MSRRDPLVSTVFHCTKLTPYKGYGLRDGSLVLHSNGFSRNGHRHCVHCGTDLGVDYERRWEKTEREEGDRRVAAEAARATTTNTRSTVKAEKKDELANRDIT